MSGQQLVHHVALCSVFAVLLAASVEALAVCEIRGGQNVISNNCIWQQTDGAGAVQLQGPPAGVNSPPPILVLDSDGKQQTPTTTMPGMLIAWVHQQPVTVCDVCSALGPTDHLSPTPAT